jgi:hypothetical protein
MLDVPFYIAEEYLYNNRIYKGKYPISIIESVCETPVFTPKKTLLEELGESDLAISGNSVLAYEETNIAQPLYVLTETDNKTTEKELEKSLLLSDI